ncbi:MAG: 2Fe-2S iron-sulfur cluster-binding protein [Phenylobacterium sp.]|nr:2Fe-2S iron-sulfur cluster-binding protein [Phenylobacterium sp.]MDO9247966.1 2Fe-2S iron-sulfur cluster-binding protein [Phenylobacterium sp.]MDP2011297.1 2Fe-2S iron-sulfur cluster-binding protein [Phenylobacterium sp.]MDP3635111.1 2Fe-2S iron-sulfur cluster-binding protein [Phenylobacterium sp.]MDP3866755.1 2Fe-2S iron-sulfur cluster-binding protein [Phenylobacterium sp.]
MPSTAHGVTFITHQGEAYRLPLRPGWTLMNLARLGKVPGIDGVCGGNCCCVTCHVHVDPAWRAHAGEPSAMEESMLDFASEVDAGSRLACQIRITEDLAGLVVRLPEQQLVLGL